MRVARSLYCVVNTGTSWTLMHHRAESMAEHRQHARAIADRRHPRFGIRQSLESRVISGYTSQDRVVVRNTWQATDSQSNRKIQFGGVVIWRIAHGQLVERWAYLSAPHPVH